jgi:uncharacterized membrane protein HdeD (DUF308 family)
MRTLILAYLIALLGLIMIVGGIWLLIDLFRQTVRAPLRHYWRAVGIICGGVAMLGLAQALRLLLLIFVQHLVH